MTIFKMSRIKSKITLYAKTNKQIKHAHTQPENVANYQGKRQPNRWLTLEFSHKDFKTAIIIIINKVIVNTLETIEKTSS